MSGLSINELTDIKIGEVIDATHNMVLACETAHTIETHITSTSSLVGVWEGTMEFLGFNGATEATVDWYPLPCVITNSTAITPNLPGATITPTDDDLLLTSPMGARYARFRRTAGSGTANRGLSDDSVQEILAATGVSRILSDSAIVMHNGKQYTVVRANIVLDATGAIVPQTSAKFGVLLDLTFAPLAGVTDTYYLTDGTLNLLGDSSNPFPLSANGAAGPLGFSRTFPYGIKTGAANRAITLTMGAGGDVSGCCAYILTDD